MFQKTLDMTHEYTNSLKTEEFRCQLDFHQGFCVCNVKWL